jgi:lycopene cyclase domain-containing protein
MHYLYLSVDLLSLLFPFIFSFYPKAPYYKKWKFLFPAIALPGIIFIVWDICFTGMGVWGFNPKYLTGIYFFNLPLEEVLFFVCIPYSCIFTYEAVIYFSKRKILSDRLTEFIADALIFGLMIFGALHHEQWYTSVTFFSTAVFMILLRRVWKVEFLNNFFFSYIFILIPFFIVNGILTGTGLEEPVVWYNNSENIGIRMGTIPVEDTFYGMLLLLMNVTVFEYLQNRNKKASSSEA